MEQSGNEQSKKKRSLSGNQSITNFTVSKTPSKRFNQMIQSFSKTKVKDEFAKKHLHPHHHRISNTKDPEEVILISDSGSDNESLRIKPSTLKESTSKPSSHHPSTNTSSSSTHATSSSSFMSHSTPPYTDTHPGASRIKATSAFCTPKASASSYSSISTSKKTSVIWSTPPINITQDKNHSKPAMSDSDCAKSVPSMASDATVSEPLGRTTPTIVEKEDLSPVDSVPPMANETMTPKSQAERLKQKPWQQKVDMSPYSKMIAEQHLNMLKKTHNGSQYPKTTPSKSPAGSLKDKFGISYALPEPAVPSQRQLGEKRPKKFSEYVKKGRNLTHSFQASLKDKNQNILIPKIKGDSRDNKTLPRGDLLNISSKKEAKPSIPDKSFDSSKKLEKTSTLSRTDSEAARSLAQIPKMKQKDVCRNNEENVPENLKKTGGHRRLSNFFELLEAKQKGLFFRPIEVPISHSRHLNSPLCEVRETSESSRKENNTSPVLVSRLQKKRLNQSLMQNDNHDSEVHPKTSSSRSKPQHPGKHLSQDSDSFIPGDTDNCQISSLDNRSKYSKRKPDVPSSMPSSRAREQLPELNRKLDDRLPPIEYDDIEIPILENRQLCTKRKRNVESSFYSSKQQHQDRDALQNPHPGGHENIENHAVSRRLSNDRKTHDKIRKTSTQPRTLEGLHLSKVKQPRTLQELTSPQKKPHSSKHPRNLENFAQLTKRNHGLKVFKAVRVDIKNLSSISDKPRGRESSKERVKNNKNKHQPKAVTGGENLRTEKAMKTREIEELLMRNVLDEINRGNSSISTERERAKDRNKIPSPRRKRQKSISDYLKTDALIRRASNYLNKDVYPEELQRWKTASNISEYNIQNRKNTTKYKLQNQDATKKFSTKSLSQDARDRLEDVENLESMIKFSSGGKYKTKTSNLLKRKFPGGITVSPEVKRSRTLNQIEHDDEKISSMLKVLSEKKKPVDCAKNINSNSPKSKRSLFSLSSSNPLEHPTNRKFSHLGNLPDSMEKTKNILNYKTKQSELDILRMRKQKKLQQKNLSEENRKVPNSHQEEDQEIIDIQASSFLPSFELSISHLEEQETSPSESSFCPSPVLQKNLERKKKGHPAKEATDGSELDEGISAESTIEVEDLHQNKKIVVTKNPIESQLPRSDSPHNEKTSINRDEKSQDNIPPKINFDLDPKPGEPIKQSAVHRDDSTVCPKQDVTIGLDDNDRNVSKKTDEDSEDDDIIFVSEQVFIDLTLDSDSEEEYEEGVDQDAFQEEENHAQRDQDNSNDEKPPERVNQDTHKNEEHLNAIDLNASEEKGHHKEMDHDVHIRKVDQVVPQDEHPEAVDENLPHNEPNQEENSASTESTESIAVISNIGNEDSCENLEEDQHPEIALKETNGGKNVQITKKPNIYSFGRMQESSTKTTLNSSCHSPDMFGSDADEKECWVDEDEDALLKETDEVDIEKEETGGNSLRNENENDLQDVEVESSEDSQNNETVKEIEDKVDHQLKGLPTAKESQESVLVHKEKRSPEVSQEELDSEIAPVENDQLKKQLEVDDKTDPVSSSTGSDSVIPDNGLPGEDISRDPEEVNSGGEGEIGLVDEVNELSLQSPEEQKEQDNSLSEAGEMTGGSSNDPTYCLPKEKHICNLGDTGAVEEGSMRVSADHMLEDDQEKHPGKEIQLGDEDQIFQDVSTALEAAFSSQFKEKDAANESSNNLKQNDLTNRENSDLENEDDDLPAFRSLKITEINTTTHGKAKTLGGVAENDLHIASNDLVIDEGEGSKEHDLLFSVNDYFDDTFSPADEVSKLSLEGAEDFPHFEYEKDHDEVKEKEISEIEETNEVETTDDTAVVEQDLVDQSEIPVKNRYSRRSQESTTKENLMLQLPSRTISHDEASTSTVCEELETFSNRPAPLTPRGTKKPSFSDVSPTELSSRTAMILNEVEFQASYKKHKLSIARLVRQKKKDCEVDKMEEILLSDLKQGGFRTTLEKHEVAGDCDDEDVSHDESEDDDTKRTLRLMKEDWGTLPILQVDSNVFDNQRPLLCYHSMSLKNHFDDTSLSALPQTKKVIVSSCSATNFFKYSDTLMYLMKDEATKEQVWSWMLKLACYHPDCRNLEEIIQSKLRKNNFDQSPLSYNDLKSALFYCGVRSSAFDEPLQNLNKNKSDITICEKCLRNRKLKRRSSENLKRVLNIINTFIVSFPCLFTSEQRTELCKVFLQLFTDLRLPNLTADVLQSVNILLDSFDDWTRRKVLLSREIITLFPKLNVIQEVADALRYCKRGLDLSHLIAFSVLKIHALGDGIETMIIEDSYDVQSVVDLVENLDPGNLRIYLKPQADDEPQMASQKRSFFYLSLLLPLLDICIGHECSDAYSAVVLEKLTSMLRTINKRIRDNGAIYRSQMKYELSLFVKNLRCMVQRAPKVTQSSIFKYLRSAPVHEEIIHETVVTDEEESSNSGCGEITYNDGDDEPQDNGQTTPKSSNIDDEELEIAEVIRKRIFGSKNKVKRLNL